MNPQEEYSNPLVMHRLPVTWTIIFTIYLSLISLLGGLWFSPLQALAQAQEQAEENSRENEELTAYYSINGGFTFAPKSSPEQKAEMPWRRVKSSHFVPTRAEVALSHQFSHLNRFNFNLRLWRIGLEDTQPQLSWSLQDEFGHGPMLGEISYTLDPENIWMPKIRIGQFSLNLSSASWSSFSERRTSINLVESDLWQHEDPYWSNTTSPLDRYVFGIGLQGLWFSPSKVTRSLAVKSNLERKIQGSYRASIAAPNTGRYSIFSGGETGWLIDTALDFRHLWWGLNLNYIHAFGIEIQQETLQFTDQVLQISTIKNERDPLLGKELTRNSLWVRGGGELKALETNYGQLWLAGLFELRSSRILQPPPLSADEQATLAESNLLGIGQASELSLLWKPSSTTYSQDWLPQHFKLAYQWRDPHHQFAFDERHRLRMEVSFYDLQQKSGLLLWWTHLWSAPTNRWSVDQDLVGISFEFFGEK